MRPLALRQPGARRWLAAAGATTLLFLAGFGGMVSTPASAAPLSGQKRVINDTHADVVSVHWVDGRLELKSKVQEPGGQSTYLDPAGVVFQLRETPETKVEVPPDAPYYDFLGPPGTQVWLAPNVQVPGVIWAGFENQGIPPGTFVEDMSTVRLRNVQGPGRLEIFGDNSDGTPLRRFSSTDPAYSTFAMANTHVHSTWAFTAPGWYTVTFDVSATTLDGTEVRSEPVDFTWYVGGDVAADLVPIATSVGLTVSPQEGQAEDRYTFTARVTPAQADGWVEFFDNGVGIAEGPVDDGVATAGIENLAVGAHQITARFVPAYDNHYAAATSEGVTVAVTSGGPTTGPTT
ncbi:choice-of-anchor M domain-containing protein, partial [Actinoplanes utahensis]